MAKSSKIDDQILLELITKGLTQAQIASYFGVRQSSVRSKIQTCSLRDARYAEALGRRSPIATNANVPLPDRVDNYTLRMFSDAASVLNKLNTIPVPDDVPGLIQRTDLQLKGLQLIEKVQKILNLNDTGGTKSLQTNTISVYLSNSAQNQSSSEPIDVDDVTSKD